MFDEGRNGKGVGEAEPSPGWDPELAQLVTWFQSVNLPQEPLDLSPGIRVVEPELAYTAIRAGIAVGPQGARAQSGALREELRRLRAAWERWRRRG